MQALSRHPRFTGPSCPSAQADEKKSRAFQHAAPATTNKKPLIMGHPTPITLMWKPMPHPLCAAAMLPCLGGQRRDVGPPQPGWAARKAVDGPGRCPVTMSGLGEHHEERAALGREVSPEGPPPTTSGGSNERQRRACSSAISRWLIGKLALALVSPPPSAPPAWGMAASGKG